MKTTVSGPCPTNCCCCPPDGPGTMCIGPLELKRALPTRTRKIHSKRHVHTLREPPHPPPPPTEEARNSCVWFDTPVGENSDGRPKRFHRPFLSSVVVNRSARNVMLPNTVYPFLCVFVYLIIARECTPTSYRASIGRNTFERTNGAQGYNVVCTVS